LKYLVLVGLFYNLTKSKAGLYLNRLKYFDILQIIYQLLNKECRRL